VTQLLETKWHGLDIRGDGGYAIEWGASDLGAYEVLRDLGAVVPIGALPEELALDLGLVREAASPLTAETPPTPRRRGKITHPGRHAHLHRIGFGMRGRGEQEAAILAELRRVNEADCEPPKPDEDVVKLAADMAGRYPRGGPAGDRERDDPAQELRQRLTAALKVGPADLEVVGAEIHGTRGPQAVCAIHLRQRATGELVSIDLYRYSQLMQGAQLSAIVAAFTGVGETFTARECALVTRLAAHDNTVDENEIAEDWGMAWLGAADVWHVDLGDRRQRWGALTGWKDRDPVALSRTDHRSVAAHGVDLLDSDGTRYVHSRWFFEFVKRDCSGLLGAPELYGRMCRVRWERRGRRGRIKASDPDGPGELQAPVFIVPAGWEARS
jgi:hypothetical protein